jgi:hypothetical protein
MESIDKQLNAVKTGQPIKKAPAKKPVKAPVKKPKPIVKPKPKIELAEYEKLRIIPLRKYAKKRGIRNWNRKTRRGLITALKLKAGKNE